MLSAAKAAFGLPIPWKYNEHSFKEEYAPFGGLRHSLGPKRLSCYKSLLYKTACQMCRRFLFPDPPAPAAMP